MEPPRSVPTLLTGKATPLSSGILLKPRRGKEADRGAPGAASILRDPQRHSSSFGVRGRGWSMALSLSPRRDNSGV